MLGVFKANTSSASAELRSVSFQVGQKSGSEVLHQFKSLNHGAVTIQCDEENSISYIHDSNATYPRQFSAMDDVFCVFSGSLDNLAQLRSLYGLPKGISEVQVVIEIYKALRDRAPYPTDQVLRDLKGSFVFAIFDRKQNRVFVAVDAVSNVPFYWGLCKGDVIAFSDNAELISNACASTFSPFPKGCFYSSQDGLYNYEYSLRKLSPFSGVDSQSKLCTA